MNGASKPELFRLSYLGCLLNLFQGRPSSDWGYSFIITRESQLYSRDLDESIDNLYSSGFISEKDHVYHIEPLGLAALSRLSKLSLYEYRIKNVTNACASLLSIPHPSIARAFRQEPNIKSATLHEQAIGLLSDSSPSMSAMYDHFKFLNEYFGERVKDLLLPSVTWLQYLAEENILSESAEEVARNA